METLLRIPIKVPSSRYHKLSCRFSMGPTEPMNSIMTRENKRGPKESSVEHQTLKECDGYQISFHLPI